MIRRHRLRHMIAPAVGLQRSLGLFILGIVAITAGAFMSFNLQLAALMRSTERSTSEFVRRFVDPIQTEVAVHWLGAALLLLGIYLIYRAARAVINQIVETLNPDIKSGKVDVYVRRQQLAQGPRIVAIGGGTGLSTLLRGLKQHSSNITAIVTVTDDGGSSGRLMAEKGMIPPGDIRNCLVALADAEKSMTDLFQYRFRNDSGSLSGHSMGNLLLAALVDQARGDFEEAINIASNVLAIRGQVMPSTLDHVGLRAVMEDGTEVVGETKIVESGRRIKSMHLVPDDVVAYKPTLEAIHDADIIILGPGSVFTSVIPPLLVPNIRDAIKASPALKVYICNVMTQPGESDQFTASQHVSAILNSVKERLFDYVMVNTGVPSPSTLEKYQEFGQHLVEPDLDRIRMMGIRVVQGNYMSETDVVRHDPVKVVSRLMTMVGL